MTTSRPNQVWHCDLTAVPTSLVFWTSWFPWSLPQRWPFCWWLAVAIDHYSRRVMGFAVFDGQPTSAAVRAFLGRTARAAGTTPKYIITDHGTQFTDEGFERWCSRRGIRQRFGAVGKYGSIAIGERLIRSLKNECTRRLLVPYHRNAFRRELAMYVHWYNGHRPHDSLECRTPDEVYFRRRPASTAPRFEPRRLWPRGSPCAGPQAKVRGRTGQRLALSVGYLSQRLHLPLVELRRAA